MTDMTSLGIYGTDDVTAKKYQDQARAQARDNAIDLVEIDARRDYFLANVDADDATWAAEKDAILIKRRADNAERMKDAARAGNAAVIRNAF